MAYDFLNVPHLADADAEVAARALVAQGEELRRMPVVPAVVLDLDMPGVQEQSAGEATPREASRLEGLVVTVAGTALAGTVNGYGHIINADMATALARIVRAGGIIVMRIAFGPSVCESYPAYCANAAEQDGVLKVSLESEGPFLLICSDTPAPE